MRFDHFIPCDHLKPYISFFAIQEAEEENTYRVLPDTNMVVGFQFKGRLTLIDETHQTVLSTAGITGLTDYYKTFRNSKNIGTVLVYFKEATVGLFFRHPLHELFRESISLENFLLRSELLVIEDRLYEAKTDRERITVVENFLLAQLKFTQPDKLVAAALALIHKANGNIRIAALAKALNTSQSPLEKRFRQAVGTTPKKFATIVRMKHVLRQVPLTQAIPDVGYAVGFYDQAHFIKEFKSFTGETPVSFFQKKKT
ncbi:MAG TPA: helix-turn-helix transcriptional regulator [Ohtaekwangia sp.]|nr:helix-turn-helix transcriptional regulator [Ohtaekwangia sp.]